ncbi:MAG: hypothetical protein VKS61_01020 [Candidatus Sericytochromatia bacterium]|nr:hypothetical protein [Candidatus Sericytochromatia bacterium]
MLRTLTFLAFALTVAGCATTPTAPRAAASTPLAASASVTAAGTRALAAFERLPSTGARKVAALAKDPGEPPSQGVPAHLLKMRHLSSLALADAGAEETFPQRYAVTDKALDQIADIKLTGFGKRNVPVLLGRLAARGYGYMGTPPTHETRYLVQVPVLEFLRATSAEASLTAGSPLFNLAAAMVDATTSFDQGFRVGISVLSVLEERYEDRELRKACHALLEKAVKAPNREAACGVILDGLRELGRRAAH